MAYKSLQSLLPPSLAQQYNLITSLYAPSVPVALDPWLALGRTRHACVTGPLHYMFFLPGKILPPNIQITHYYTAFCS
jgi:hypothetical protein